MENIKGQLLTDLLLPMAIVTFIVGVGVVLLYQHFQKNLFIQKLKQETLKNIHQNDLLRANIEAQEAERKRIAQDLHDELGALLSIIKMNILMLEKQHKDVPGNLLSGLQNVCMLSETALTSIRNISHRLMPPQLEAFGLVKTLESVTDQINNAGAIKIQLQAPLSLTGLPWDVTLGLYRIIMELINNTLKHSGATSATVEIYLKNNAVVCNYADNGKGLGSDHINKGLGHKSIDGRISALGGVLSAGTAAGPGFYATIRIPVRQPV